MSVFHVWASNQDWLFLRMDRCTANLELPAVNDRRSRILSACKEVENAPVYCRECQGRPVAVFDILHLGKYTGNLALLLDTLDHFCSSRRRTLQLRP
jgi:hypothetical protein